MHLFFRKTGYVFLCLVLAALLAAALFWALSIGTVKLPPDVIWGAVGAQLTSGTPIDTPGKGAVHDIVWLLRLPRLLLAAVIGNTTGGYFYGSYFGGLSGVCFALIGYVWLRGYQIAAYRAVVKPGLFYASVVFMLAGFVHLISGMADWVHAAGLATGLLIALPYYLITTRWPQHQEQE